MIAVLLRAQGQRKRNQVGDTTPVVHFAKDSNRVKQVPKRLCAEIVQSEGVTPVKRCGAQMARTQARHSVAIRLIVPLQVAHSPRLHCVFLSVGNFQRSDTPHPPVSNNIASLPCFHPFRVLIGVEVHGDFGEVLNIQGLMETHL